jgi:flagellar protein FlaG
MSVETIGTRMDSVPLQEHLVDRAAAHKTQAHQAHVEQFTASLPGNNAAGSETKKYSAATAELERVSLAFDRRLQFVVDHQSNEVIVKVIDRETDKVIKVLPPEELQRLHSKLKETIGFLFDQQV